MANGVEAHKLWSRVSAPPLPSLHDPGIIQQVKTKDAHSQLGELTLGKVEYDESMRIRKADAGRNQSFPVTRRTELPR